MVVRSLSRLLSSPAIRTERQHLLTGRTVLPQEVQELVERERERAYAAGRADGMAQAAAAALDASGAAAALLRDTVEHEIARLGDARAAHDGLMLDIAREIAAYVVDAVDTTAVDAVVQRIRAALADIDDVGLVAHVHAGQADAVATALADQDLQVMPAEDVAPGDARLVGRWSVADLGQHQRWAAVQELFDAAS
jgi:flagellar biosynthesis/type III secretory pathway protein FliH